MLNAYTIMMIIVVVFSFLLHGNEKGSRKYIAFSCIAMFIIMAFRDVTKIGVDSSSSYLHLYQRMSETSLSQIVYAEGFNSGFNLLFKLINTVFGDSSYQMAIIIISAFCLFSFAFLVNKYSLSPVTSICAFWGLCFYIFMFDALKQAIAMSVLVFAFDAIVAKKPIRFYIFVVVASLFHAPAFIFIPIYLVAHIKIPSRYYIPLIISLFVLIYAFRSSIVSWMLGAYRYEELSEQYAAKDVSFIGGSVIVYLGILLVCYLFRKPDQENDFVYATLFKMMVFATILLTFCYYNNIFKRLSDYYAYFCVLLITYPFDNSSNEKLQPALLSSQNGFKTIGKVVFCSYGFIYFAMYIINASKQYLPFRFFW